MIDFEPKYITFDCYGRLTNFQMTETVRGLYGDKLDQAKMDEFVEYFRGYRLDEVPGAWKPFREVVVNSVRCTCERTRVPFDAAVAPKVYEAVPTWGSHPDVPEGLSRLAKKYKLVILSNASDEKRSRILREGHARYFLQLADARIDYCWGGLVDMTADRLPRAGQHEGLFYPMGYSGHGVQISVHMGRVMADVMFGAAACNPWRTLEWPAIPGHFGLAWFLPLVGAYYRLQDVLH